MAAKPTTATPQAHNRWWSLSVASLATLIVTADTGQLSIALPLIITDLHADLTLASWIALVYALITASLYLPCGRMADLLGVGNLFLAGFILYALSSIAAGSSQSAVQLVIFRALQAAGSALIMANNFALVTALFPPEERGRAMGIAGGAISAIGYTMGPVIGGLLTHGFGWRSNFFVSSVLAVGGFGCRAGAFAAGKFPTLSCQRGEKRAFRFDRRAVLCLLHFVDIVRPRHGPEGRLAIAAGNCFFDRRLCRCWFSLSIGSGARAPAARSGDFSHPRVYSWQRGALDQFHHDEREHFADAFLSCSSRWVWIRCAPGSWSRRRRWRWRYWRR